MFKIIAFFIITLFSWINVGMTFYSYNKTIETGIWTKLVRIMATECVDKGNNKITEIRTILQRESQNS